MPSASATRCGIYTQECCLAVSNKFRVSALLHGTIMHSQSDALGHVARQVDPVSLLPTHALLAGSEAETSEEELNKCFDGESFKLCENQAYNQCWCTTPAPGRRSCRYWVRIQMQPKQQSTLGHTV